MSGKYYGIGKYHSNKELTAEEKKEAIVELKDSALSDWYATYYDAEFCVKCDSPGYLVDFYNSRVSYKKRFEGWFKEENLSGNKHLDIGFASGKTIYWLSKLFSEIRIDTFDFNKNCENLMPYLKELIPQISNISIDDASKFCANNESYDSITAIDFYEHTPMNIMIESLKINYNILKKGGTMYLYLGKTICTEHINLMEDSKTISLCEKMGFEFKGENNSLLLFSKRN